MGRGDLELLDVDMGRQTWPHPGPLCQSEPTCLPILGPEVRFSWPHPISVSYSQISLLFPIAPSGHLAGVHHPGTRMH